MSSITRSMDVPICAVCDKPVERWMRMRDMHRCVTVFTASCHGASQSVELTDLDLMCAGPNGVTVGRAFEFPVLEQK